MDRHPIFLKFIPFILNFLWAGSSLAADITVLDQLGLARAAKGGIGQAVVLISRDQAGDLPVLRNVDGIRGDIAGTWDEATQYFKFDGVTSGTWKIDTDGEVKKVKILPVK